MTDLTTFLALVYSLTTEPVSILWRRNAATGSIDWTIQTATCTDFDRLAAATPTPRDRRWLNGDKRDHPGSYVHRHHGGNDDGHVVHLCWGCTPILIDLPDQTCSACGAEHPGGECLQDDLFGGAS